MATSKQLDGVRRRLRAYAYLMRLDKPIGALLLLWPTLWALWIAGGGYPNVWNVLVFTLGVMVMRAAGCVINDYADRNIDPHVQRTRHRPLASGEVGAGEALVLFVLLCVVAFGLVLTLNRLTIMYSFAAVLLAVTYPFMKRYTHLPQVHLGVAFGWGIPMSFAAEMEMVPALAWLLLVASIFWTVAYDTMYAMVDRVDDLKIGVKSTAILFGDADRLIIGFFQIAAVLVLILVGSKIDRGSFYYIGLAVASGFALYQQSLIRERRESLCFQAFLNNNWFGAAVLTGIVVDYWSAGM